MGYGTCKAIRDDESKNKAEVGESERGKRLWPDSSRVEKYKGFLTVSGNVFGTADTVPLVAQYGPFVPLGIDSWRYCWSIRQ